MASFVFDRKRVLLMRPPGSHLGSLLAHLAMYSELLLPFLVRPTLTTSAFNISLHSVAAIAHDDSSLVLFASEC